MSSRDAIYRAIVKTDNGKFNYIGATATSLKKRLRNHLNSFKIPNLINANSLSKLEWSLKRNDKEYSIEWEIVDTAKAYREGAIGCELCGAEIVNILKYRETAINGRREFGRGVCKHKLARSFANFNLMDN